MQVLAKTTTIGTLGDASVLAHYGGSDRPTHGWEPAVGCPRHYESTRECCITRRTAGGLSSRAERSTKGRALAKAPTVKDSKVLCTLQGAGSWTLTVSGCERRYGQ